MKYTYIDSPLGDLLVMRDEIGITGLYMPTGKHALGEHKIGEYKKGEHNLRMNNATERDDIAFDDVRMQLKEYFARERQTFDLPLHAKGNAFQHKVWKALREIPYGTTTTYGKQAASIGLPNAARAVGTANGQNPISIIVPCHRVIGANGKLVGYGGGLDAKQLLLTLESPDPAEAPLF